MLAEPSTKLSEYWESVSQRFVDIPQDSTKLEFSRAGVGMTLRSTFLRQHSSKCCVHRPVLTCVESLQ